MASQEKTPTPPPALSYQAPSEATQPWRIIENLSLPESAHFSRATRDIFISNIAGDLNAKDGKGWILKAEPSGIVIVPGARLLNGLAIDTFGTMYVTDTLEDKIFRIKDGKVSTFIERDVPGPNGILIDQNKLIVASWGTQVKPDFSASSPGSVYEIDIATKKINRLTQPLGRLDGIVENKRGNYLVSDWEKGVIYEVGQSSKANILLRNLTTPAGIAFIAAGSIVIVPQLKINSVVAYDLH